MKSHSGSKNIRSQLDIVVPLFNRQVMLLRDYCETNFKLFTPRDSEKMSFLVSEMESLKTKQVGDDQLIMKVYLFKRKLNNLIAKYCSDPKYLNEFNRINELLQIGEIANVNNERSKPLSKPPKKSPIKKLVAQARGFFSSKESSNNNDNNAPEKKPAIANAEVGVSATRVKPLTKLDHQRTIGIIGYDEISGISLRDVLAAATGYPHPCDVQVSRVITRVKILPPEARPNHFRLEIDNANTKADIRILCVDLSHQATNKRLFKWLIGNKFANDHLDSPYIIVGCNINGEFNAKASLDAKLLADESGVLYIEANLASLEDVHKVLLTAAYAGLCYYDAKHVEHLTDEGFLQRFDLREKASGRQYAAKAVHTLFENQAGMRDVSSMIASYLPPEDASSVAATSKAAREAAEEGAKIDKARAAQSSKTTVETVDETQEHKKGPHSTS
jgi:hypothetical protein